MSQFWTRAQRAAESARLLLDAGDCNGAVNRAYFAMFHAARSTLDRVHPQSASAKRHATVIGRFALHVVRGNGIDPAIGRAFNLAFDQRLIADYEPEGVNAADASKIVEDVTLFLAAVSHLNEGAQP